VAGDVASEAFEAFGTLEVISLAALFGLERALGETAACVSLAVEERLRS
jgi:hypothetical protein